MADPRARVILEAKRRGEGAFKKFDADLRGIASRAAIVGAATVASLGLITRKSFETIDALAKTSDKLGILPQDLAGLQFAAQQTGVGTDKFNMALQRMVRRIGEVATFGRGEAMPALEALGIAIEDIAGRTPDQQFRMLAEAMQGVDDQGQRVALTMKFMDSEGVDLVNTLNLGTEGLDAMQAEAEQLGIALNRVDAAKIEQANDAINAAKNAAQGIGNVIAVEVAPFITGMVRGFLDSETAVTSLEDTVRRFVDGAVFGVGLIADAMWGWQIIIDSIALGYSKIELAMAKASDVARDFFGTTEEDIQRQIDALNEVYEIQSRGMSDAQKEGLREVFDQQIAVLDIERSRTDELESALALQALQYKQLVESVPPSERIAETVRQWREDAEGAAQATAEARAALLGDGALPDIADPNAANAEREAEQARQAAERNFERIVELVSTRSEIEQMAFDRRKQMVEDAVAHELTSRERANEIIAELEMQKNANLDEIARQQIVGGTDLTREQLANQLATLDGAQSLRLEREREWLVRRMDMLRAGYDEEFLTAQEYQQLAIDAAEEAQQRITDITREGYDERAKFAAKSTKEQAQQVLGSLIQMTQGVAQTNKTMFRINKLAAIGNAVINTAQGVTKALAEYPPPLSFAMAAAQAAAGAAQISAIKSTSFGGGTTPSVAGSAPVANGQPIQNAISTPTAFERDPSRDLPRIEVVIQGSVIGSGGAEELVDFIQDSLSDRLNNRDEVLFTTESRQASI